MISPERWPRYENSHTTSDSRVGPLVTASATPHTKGSYTSLIATTSFDAYWCCVELHDVAQAATATDVLVDIAIDPAGGTSYTVIIPNIVSGYVGSPPDGTFQTWFPVFIPKGSQVAARCQALIVSETVRVGIQLLGGHNRSNLHPHRGAIQDYGIDLALSRGTVMVNTGANTKSAWVQIGADTVRRHSGLAVVANGGDAILGSNSFLLDIGIDPAGGISYTVVVPDLSVRFSNSEKGIMYFPFRSEMIGIDIPAGSAIGARTACSAANANDDMRLAVYGF